MGTNSPIQSATLRMQAKLHKTLTSKIRKCGNQIGDTLTVNSLLLSQTIFNTRVEFVSKKAHTTANKLGRQFIRGTNYLMTNDQRHAAKEHGTLTPLINQEHLATTLQATWFFQILTHTNPKDRPILMNCLSNLLAVVWAFLLTNSTLVLKMVCESRRLLTVRVSPI